MIIRHQYSKTGSAFPVRMSRRHFQTCFLRCLLALSLTVGRHTRKKLPTSQHYERPVTSLVSQQHYPPDDRDKKSAKIVTKVLKKHHLQPCIRKTGEITDGACILQPCIRKTGEITDGACKIGVMCALREPSPAPKKAQPRQNQADCTVVLKIFTALLADNHPICANKHIFH